MQSFVELGYIGLFLSAFLAATILPLSSELVLGSLLVSGWNPIYLVIIATIGNVFGSVVNYWMGYWANEGWLKKRNEQSKKALTAAEQRFKKWGMLSLCFAWVPIIGDPITIVAGVLKVKFHWFVLLVSLGKGARYVALAYVTLQVSH